ncbi:TIGR03790 family protein [Neorhizobium sp. NCHU2750]|uniref:TIGR03790 family protein n=1 Tax=Neorhizobium sp. NCHU2750 TaxID=1825976 RepID=UPI000E74A2CD|nr:hypothetical protein NCHU2750_11940 [Neorhizobium sp. NCHU2750]
MRGKVSRRVSCALAVLGFVWPVANANETHQLIPVVPLVSPQQTVLTPATLGVIVNLNDPDSVALGDYYVKARGIPRANIIGLQLPRVNFVAGHLFRREFAVLQASPRYRSFGGFALAFDRPYRVDANQSITSAFTQGLTDIAWKGVCNITEENPDRGRMAGEPLLLKPAFLLDGGAGLHSSLDLVDRGLSADVSEPNAKILLATTSDPARSIPRKASMERATRDLPDFVELRDFPDQLVITPDPVIGLQTGLAVWKTLASLRFLPGAYVDHLTSSGGALNDNRGQTTAAQIIAAGATASFGTVREPCNFPPKFPDPERMAKNYLGGDTLLEAYWKSIDWTTEGLFLGEPLARPFPVFDAILEGGRVKIRINRQTRLSLGGGKSSQKCNTPTLGAGHTVSLFSVETGHPVFIRDLCVSQDGKPGDIVDTVDVIDATEKLMLGVLVRKPDTQ